MSGRGRTYAGRPAILPAQGYAGPEAAVAAELPAGTGQEVRFHGEDGRGAVFSFAGLPLPGWHHPLAVALAERTGPTGGLRTLASANGAWAITKRLLRFLALQPERPFSPADLTRADMERFLRHRSATIGSTGAWGEVRHAGRLLASLPAESRANQDVLDFVFQRVEGLAVPVKTGYSDNELRQIVKAARSDVVMLRNRIRAGHALAARWQEGDDGLTGPQLEEARLLADMAATGQVRRGFFNLADRRDLAGRLFVTSPDIWPLMILLVALTGRSPDALKELPADHRVLEGLAVELVLVKRRRGNGRWHETVTWEIGRPERGLHYPGGFYLLLHELMAAGRVFSGSPVVWSIWRNADGGSEHVSPFSNNLNMPVLKRNWAEAHGLTGDDGRPLRLDLQRLKTSIEVRRTRQLGGHLPSAARTNTTQVLFRNYLRGDPTVRDWAEQVAGEGIADAEQEALRAHASAMRAMGGGPVVSGIRGRPFRAGMTGQAAEGQGGHGAGAAWTRCANPHAHPATGQPCQLLSFLDCFHCGNCVITAANLPGLVSLDEALLSRRQRLAESEWWGRYGPAWAAIRYDILPRFTPAQLKEARAAAPHDALLDLVEDPWEVP